MKVTNEGRLAFGQLVSGLGGDPDLPEGETPHDCCDIDPPPDRAEDAPAFTVTTPTTDDPIVQVATVGSTQSKRVLGVPGTVGNTLIGVVFDRDYSGVEMPPLGGWTEIATGVDAIAFDRACTVLYHVVTADETPYTSGGDEVTYPLTPSSGQHTLMIELAGTYDSIFNDDDSVASTTNMQAGGPVTPGAGDDVFVFGASVIYSNVGSVAEDADTLSLRDEWTGFSPYAWAAYRIVINAAGSYSVGGTMASASHYAGVTAVFAISAPGDPEWTVPAPNTVDGDDSTYQEIDGTDVLQVDLGAPFNIVSSRLLVGSEFAGTVTYRILGANAADFSDVEELDVVTFDTTGSFTPDEIDFVWTTAQSYRYFELIGSNENRRVFTWELYEPDTSLGQDHTHPDLQEQIDALEGGDDSDFHGWYNVEDFGAVHDGTTDDTVAIQAAIDACFADGGGTVWFPTGIYQIDGALQDTGTYNSQLEIPYNASGIIGIRFLGERSMLRSSWNGTITGTPSVISAGTHDTHTFNGVFVKFERIQIQVHDDPKLTAIDMTGAATVRWDDLLLFTASTPATPPTNANAVGLDMPWGFNDQNSGGTDIYIIGFYTGIRPSEQTVGTAVYIAYCTRAAEFRGSPGPPDYLAHMASFQRFNVWFCPRGLVFTGERRSVNISVMDIEHDDPSFVVVYDIDDASNYARGFVGIHISDYDTGDTADALLINGGSGLSLFEDVPKRWRLASTVDIPIGTNPSTNPTNGRRLYTASATGHLTGRKSDGTTNDYETDWGGVTISGTPSTGQVPTATSTTAATWQTVSAGSSGAVGPILIEDTPAGSPLIFADLLQNDDGTDLLYEDI